MSVNVEVATAATTDFVFGDPFKCFQFKGQGNMGTMECPFMFIVIHSNSQ